VEIAEARRKFDRIIDNATAGKTTVITRDGTPVAQLAPPSVAIAAPAPAMCPGYQQDWAIGDRGPVCPGCLRSPRQLKVSGPSRHPDGFRGRVSAHHASG
jgi:hypothetical protein